MVVALNEVPLVATCLDPSEDLPYQIACLRRWRDIGLRVHTFNVASEREQLLAAGIELDALVEIDSHEAVQGSLDAPE